MCCYFIVQLVSHFLTTPCFVTNASCLCEIGIRFYVATYGSPLKIVLTLHGMLYTDLIINTALFCLTKKNAAWNFPQSAIMIFTNLKQ